MKTENFSRRNFLKLTGSAGLLTALGQFNLAEAAGFQDYKALVCIFLFGGNDGHNTVIPMSASDYPAYANARGGLALSGNKLLPVTTTNGRQFALNYGMVELLIKQAQPGSTATETLSSTALTECFAPPSR